MDGMNVVGFNGSSVALDGAAVEAFKASLRGALLLPGDDGYDTSRSVWNAMIDRNPALVVRAAGTADVRRAVTFAHRHRLLTAVKGGGHNIAGNAVCEGGLLIDLSGMRAVTVDPIGSFAHVEPGATLADLDHECQAFGLATPVGINSTTGVAGLTLGGGFGWLSRKHGMTVDNLVAADVVTADSRLLRASASEHPDLFWALRGGSGNFGVVTRFQFRLHPVGPEVLTGMVVYALDDAAAALKQFREYVKRLGDETNVWTVMRKAPPLPFLPPHVHGKEIIAFCAFHCGNADEGRKALEPVRHMGTVLGEFSAVQPYTAWQKTFDALLTPGARNYWKSHNFVDLSDGAIDVAVQYVKNLPSPHCEIFFGLIGGATTRQPRDATAYSHRDAIYVCNVHGRWETAAEDGRCIEWARGFFREAAPFATGGVYVNFLTDDESERIGAAYGPEYARLVAAKDRYDPDNLFRMNQNIPPSAAR